MFIGHFALGLAAKKVAPGVSLGTYFLAVQWADLLWPTLLLSGYETVEIVPGITRVTPLDFTSYPISHSLLMMVLWGGLLGLVNWLSKRNSKAALVIALAVVSHWVLDFVTHRPDMPLWPGDSPLLGLGLWNSVWGTVLVEVSLFIGCVWMYNNQTHPNNGQGKWAFWSLVIFLLIIYIMNLTGPPPPNVVAIAWAGHLQWLMVLWGYWIDRNRSIRPVAMDKAKLD